MNKYKEGDKVCLKDNAFIIERSTKYLSGHLEYEAQHNGESWTLYEEDIQPYQQLSEDVEEIFVKANEALQHDFNDNFDYRHKGTFLPQLEQHIQAQAKEIEELEEDNKELTNYYDKNKDYEQQYNVVVNKLNAIRKHIDTRFRDIADAKEYHLANIDDISSKLAYDKLLVKQLELGEIKQILEESK